MSARILHGDCLDVLRTLPDNSVDAIVTDPPAGIAFMGKAWDGDKGGREQWSAWLADVMREALRVVKPGGHALVWALPRTSHWTACGLEDAGWEIRDRVVHLFGTGFPKSLDVGKAIDKAAGAQREVVGSKIGQPGYSLTIGRPSVVNFGPQTGDPTREAEITAPATPEAQQWHGWGTALKPAAEDWWLARKPLSESTVAANVLRWGTGAVNVDGCRVEGKPRTTHADGNRVGNRSGASTTLYTKEGATYEGSAGRWPANVTLDASQAAALDEQSGEAGGGTGRSTRGGGRHGEWNPTDRTDKAGQTVRGDGREIGYGDTGGASRFFATFPTFRYQAKAPTRERPFYFTPDCDHPEARPSGEPKEWRTPYVCPTCGTDARRVSHPTVKSLALMSFLARLVCPPGGIILDMFAGSGATGEAAIMEGFNAILIEQDAENIPLIEIRIDRATNPPAPKRTNTAPQIDTAALFELDGEGA